MTLRKKTSRALNADGYEPIAGDPTLFRAPEGHIAHLSHEEQAKRGWPSRKDEQNERVKKPD
jgi:hypothetical protein